MTGLGFLFFGSGPPGRSSLVIADIALENGPFQLRRFMMTYLFKMVLLHGYVKKPEGKGNHVGLIMLFFSLCAVQIIPYFKVVVPFGSRMQAEN